MFDTRSADFEARLKTEFDMMLVGRWFSIHVAKTCIENGEMYVY
jgi:hypothetical protein